MSKQKKDQDDLELKKIILVTAIINLITAIINLLS